jgi:hypothetical protein
MVFSFFTGGCSVVIIVVVFDIFFSLKKFSSIRPPGQGQKFSSNFPQFWAKACSNSSKITKNKKKK